MNGLSKLKEIKTEPIVTEKPQDFFPVSVIMQSRPSNNQWVDQTWESVGVVTRTSNTEKTVKRIEQGELTQLIYSHLSLRLFIDECESYYHNLMSPEPGCFIVAREEDEDGEETDIPIPFLVTMSFDEAHAYLEGDDTVYAVAIPPDLYQHLEAYVIEHYSAEKRTKRKRKDWRKGE